MKNTIYLKLFLIFLFPFFGWFFLQKIIENNFKKFDELALGQNNIILNDKILNNKIICNTLGNFEECIKYLKQYKKKILWIGNSHLNAINQPDSNAKLAAYIASENLRKKEIGLVTFSSPNINFQEYLAVFSYVTKKIDIDYIILSLCFDDTREDNVRTSLTETEDAANETEDAANETAYYLLIEKNITNYLEKKIQWKTIRKQAQAHTFEILYKLRNFIFNINPSTPRALIGPIYEKNMEALKTILKDSQNKKIQAIMYINPIRNDYKLPYLEDQYILFKTDVLNLSKKYNLILYNLEKIIPNSFWGYKNSTKFNSEKEIDFMHFKQEGHVILSEYVIQILTKYF